MEFPPCHIGDFFPAIRGVSSRPYVEIKTVQLQFTVRSCEVTKFELRCGHTEIRSPLTPSYEASQRHQSDKKVELTPNLGNIGIVFYYCTGKYKDNNFKGKCNVELGDMTNTLFQD